MSTDARHREATGQSGRLRTVEAGDIEQVIGLEVALLTRQVRSSAARLEELLDSDFREIGASGRFWTRPEIISTMTHLDTNDEPIEATEFEGMMVGPDLILLTYVSDPRGRAARRTSLWRRSRGVWRVLHHQGTLLAGV